MAEMVEVPGAGDWPAPGARPAPLDLDAVGDLYTALQEACHSGDAFAAELLAHACADLLPALVGEVARVDALRRELAAELDRRDGTGGAW